MRHLLAAVKRHLPAQSAGKGRDGLLFQRLFWGTLAGCLATILLAESPVLDTMELNLLEWRFKIAHELNSSFTTENKSNDLVLVTYDDEDQFDLEAEPMENGPDPIQEVLAELIHEIEKQKPLLIVVDIDLTGRPDPRLVQVFRRYRSNIVLAYFGNLDDPADFPSQALRNACAAFAHDSLIKEANGLVCKLPLKLSDTDGTIARINYWHGGYDSLPRAVSALMTSKGGVGPTPGQIPRFTRQDFPLYINFSGTKYDTFRTTDIINSEIEKNTLNNKVVILGTRFTQKKDNTPQLRTPLENNVTHAKIQADAINTIHKNKIIHTFPQDILHHLLLLLGGMLGAISSVMKMSTRTTAFLCFSMALVCITQILFQLANLHVPIVPILAVIMLSYIFGTLIYLDTDLRLRNRELADAREAMQVRAEQERQRIAEDLHDETLPALSSVARMADRLSMDLEDNPVPSEMREKLDNAVVEMRRVINDLHPSVLETMGFKPALENLLSILERDMEIEANFEDKDDADDYQITDLTKLQLYRIVQESLNNVQKHSNASKVDVKIGLEEESLCISIVDNGDGIDESKIKVDSHGLVNIKQRAQLIGARVKWSVPEKFKRGCQLKLTLPLNGTGKKAQEKADN